MLISLCIFLYSTGSSTYYSRLTAMAQRLWHRPTPGAKRVFQAIPLPVFVRGERRDQ